MKKTAFMIFAILLCASSIACAEVCDEKLITWLTFDEGNGVDIKDRAPEGLVQDDSQLKGDATWTKDGVYGGAVRFTGKKGSYVYLHHCSKDIQAITTGGPHNRTTFAFWFKCDDSKRAQTIQTLFETGGYHNNLNIFLYEGQIYAGVISGYPSSLMGPQWLNTLDDLTEGASFVLQDSRWYHLAFIIEADETPVAGAYRVYLDGKLIMSGRGVHLEGHGAQAGLGAVNDEAIYPHERDKHGNSTGWRTIPTKPHAPDADGNRFTDEQSRGIYPFAGCMDDFRIYKRVLSTDELQMLHTEGREALNIKHE